MLWRPSHTDTAKAAILGLIDVIKFGNPQGVSQSIRGSRDSFGPAVWEKAERLETIESERMDEDRRPPRNQPDGGWQVVRSREERVCRHPRKRVRESESVGMAARCASRCVGFWVYRVVTDCYRFDRLRFAR